MTRTRTRPQGPGQGQGPDHKNKDLTPKEQDKDKDLKNVLKESLRTRTRINISEKERMENIKYGRRRKGRWTPDGRKPRTPEPIPIAGNSPSEEEMGHWTPTGVEPKDYDDDDELRMRCLRLTALSKVCMGIYFPTFI